MSKYLETFDELSMCLEDLQAILILRDLLLEKCLGYLPENDSVQRERDLANYFLFEKEREIHIKMSDIIALKGANKAQI